ncbi:GNAT family N-acetyltransferase [Gammaproteobacteria bacterium AB-CW1]|uniref:GNAT family N-acetyltransferase n=1 Tax=Natronospira elongata TaxID=3110268 RepID=A0AAP6JI63_9GAMM|nr:GNAT family N-acetyltransferase [Gammaproteobacteria bacterium AB-CW1]
MIRRLAGIDEVQAVAWNRLVPADQPALRHEFLSLLESSGAVCPETGWTAAHRVIEDGQGGLRAILPLYEKSHSFGEFVFDFAWADAWHRSGRPYYPKLTAAIPFTPVIGPRLMAAEQSEQAALAEAMESQADGIRFSTAHALFCSDEDAGLLAGRGWIQRDGCRFLWRNRNYRDFDEWLGEMRSKKRKNLRRERRQVHEQGIQFRWREGEQLSSVDWNAFYELYARTYHERMQTPYLPASFFPALARKMPESVVLIEALDSTGTLVAMAFCLRGNRTLYGRHWGSRLALDGLHFETCYHQGIEYCIARGLDYFDPGTQGEHKLLRGFPPVKTRSMHWIPDPALRRAVADFAAAEARQNQVYMAAARAHLPFHREHRPDSPERAP